MYQITLRPLGAFFFGGEHGFTDESGYDRYFARSELFPQQTHLLGVLRRTVLFNEDFMQYYQKGSFIKKNKKTDSREKVGEKWHINKEPNLGVIDSISPVFITDGIDIYIQAPLDTNLKLKPSTTKSLAKYNSKDSQAFRLMKSDFTYFSTKDYFEDGFLSCRGKIVPKDKIYIESYQVGNKKRYEGGTYDEAFYKKQSFMFKDRSYAFTFFVKHNGLKEIKDTHVSLGADGGRFLLSIKNINDQDINNSFNSAIKPNTQTKITLLSDALITSQMIKKSSFYIAKKIPFRYMANEKIKSQRTYFATRGSVFFFKDLKNANEFAKELNNKTSLHKIGYNQYILTKGANDEKLDE